MPTLSHWKVRVVMMPTLSSLMARKLSSWGHMAHLFICACIIACLSWDHDMFKFLIMICSNSGLAAVVLLPVIMFMFMMQLPHWPSWKNGKNCCWRSFDILSKLRWCLPFHLWVGINPLWPSDVIWQHRSGWTLAEGNGLVLLVCLMSENYSFKISATFQLNR